MKISALTFACIFLLCLQQTLADFQVQIEVGDTAQISNVSVAGGSAHPINSAEIDAFGLSDSNLKSKLQQLVGKTPNDVALGDPTANGNNYQKYNFEPVTTNYVALYGEVLSMTSTPMTLNNYTLSNKSGKIPAIFTATTSVVESNTVSTEWSKTTSINASASISYGIAFFKGSASLTYTESMQSGGSNSSTVTVGNSEGVQVTLQPGEEVDVIISAAQGSMVVRVYYQAYLSGQVYYHYDNQYDGHYFWAMDVSNFVNNQTVTMSEDITINYYSDADVTITDVDTGLDVIDPTLISS